MKPVTEELCNDEGNCTGPLGHDGPHGAWMGGGIIIAPRPNLGQMTPVDVQIPCDSCGKTMTAERSASGGGRLSCSCEQSWTFDANGSSTCVKTTIYPSNPKYVTPRMQLENLAHLRWKGQAALALGVPFEKTWAARESELAEAETKYRTQIANHRWWKFWSRT